MRDIGMDRWWWGMEEHGGRGHRLTTYPEMGIVEQNLFLKEQRINFWEKHRRIPNINDLDWWEHEVKI